jgi:uncharacterized membrane protein
VRLAVAGTAVFVLACVLVPEGLLHTGAYADVNVYSAYAHRMLDGEIPYRDFFDEYPPLAQPVFLAAASPLAFKLLMAACGVAIVWLLALAFRSWQAVAVFAASPLLVGPIFLNAYDLWPALLLLAALVLFLRGHPIPAFALLALATAAKAYPAVVLPIALLHVARSERVRGLATYAAVLLLVHLPFLVTGPGGLRHGYVLQAKRGLELNSLGAAILLWNGYPRLENQPPGSLNVVGGAAHTFVAASTIAVVVAVALAAFVYWRGRISFLVACAAAVTGFVAFNKVFSAQYVEWLAALVPLAGTAAAGLTAVVLWLTSIVFDHRTQIAEKHGDLWSLFARDALCVVLYLRLLLARDRF